MTHDPKPYTLNTGHRRWWTNRELTSRGSNRPSRSSAWQKAEGGNHFPLRSQCRCHLLGVRG